MLPPTLQAVDVRRETVKMAMRDGIRLATDIYLPPATQTVYHDPDHPSHVLLPVLDSDAMPSKTA